VDECTMEPAMERSDAKPIQKIESFASTASSKTTLQPHLDRMTVYSTADVARAPNVLYPMVLKS